MKFIEKAFNNLMESENNDIQQILLNESNYMKKFFRFSNFFFYACVSVCAATPFVENHLICQIYMPGFSEHLYKFNTPLFWLFFIIQNILIYFGIACLKFYICFVVNCIYFGTTMMQILKLKVRSLKMRKPLEPMSELEAKKILNEEIVGCIKMHLEIKTFVYNSYKHFLINIFNLIGTSTA